MITTNEIIDFVKEFTGLKNIKEDTDIFDNGTFGDDFHELISKFTEKYSVDMTNYLWYFHSNEEGQNIGSLFFAPPYKRIKRIPITPLLLTKFANDGKWNIEYPKHTIPKIRFDLIINGIVVILVFICMIMYILEKC